MNYMSFGLLTLASARAQRQVKAWSHNRSSIVMYVIAEPQAKALGHTVTLRTKIDSLMSVGGRPPARHGRAEKR